MTDEEVERRIAEERKTSERVITYWLVQIGHPDLARRLEKGEHRGPVLSHPLSAGIPSSDSAEGKRTRYSAELGCILDDVPEVESE